MNTTEMINRLGIRLEDSAQQAFSPATLLRALNNAQIKLANMLHYNYLTELQVLQSNFTNFTGASGAPYYKAISSLTYPVLRGGQGILSVKMYGTSEPFCTRVELNSMKRIENTYLGGSTTNPIYYIIYNRLYVDNGATAAATASVPAVDVYYLKTPSTMAYTFDISAAGTPSTTTFLGDASNGFSVIDDTYNGAVIYSTTKATYHIVSDYDAADNAGGSRFFTVTPAATGNFGDDSIYFVTNRFDTISILPSATNASMYVETCELNPSLHELVVSLAEAECWGIDGQPDRRTIAEDIVTQMVATLNAKYEEPTGIGTDSR